MEKIYNFSAGPAVMPKPVLEQAQKEMLDYGGTGMSVMEMSHRSSAYEAIIGRAESVLRELMGIPANYKVLFLTGGASTQFAMVPLNLFGKSMRADFFRTGMWAKKAQEQSEKYGKVNVVGSSEDKIFNYIPAWDNSKFDNDADFFHITTNNTIYGTRINELPKTGSVPLVADMSSSILSQVYDVNSFGLIYAGAQKNMGASGVTVAIIRDDLIGKPLDITPIMLRYDTHSENESMYNTPPTYAIYIAMLVFEWLADFGGIAEMEKQNIFKAGLVYDFLDNSSLFSGTVEKKDRSLMNIPFITGKDELDAKFIKEATAQGLVNLKGHRSVGGMRASIYNAMEIEGVNTLVNFMKKFETENK